MGHNDPPCVQGMVTMKKPPAALKRTVAALALLLGCSPTMVPDPNSKKKVEKSCFLTPSQDAEEVPDYWIPGKKLVQDPEMAAKIEDFDREGISEETVAALKNIAADFDPAVVAKASLPGEVI